MSDQLENQKSGTEPQAQSTNGDMPEYYTGNVTLEAEPNPKAVEEKPAEDGERDADKIIMVTKALREGVGSYGAYFRRNLRVVYVEPYTGTDFSSMTGVFPGQGVAFEGQFQNWNKGQSKIRDYFQQTDNWAKTRNLPSPSLYLVAPQRLSPLVKPKLKNFALFTLQIALFEELNQLGLRFSRLASYSFGEYAAWVAAGVLKFSQMLDVVYLREELAPPPFEYGASILVGASPEKIAEHLGDYTYYVANRVLPEQTIITCEKHVADDIIKALFAKRILCNKVNELAQPYHSKLMEGTREKLSNILSEKLSQMNVEVNPPKVPIYSSTLRRWVTPDTFKPDEFFEVLSKQLTEPVSFMDLDNCMKEVGRQSVIELGPGESCTEILKKLDQENTYTYLPLGDYFRTETKKRKAYDDRLRQSKFAMIVATVVARLTGYHIEDIKVEDRFQEDLGIDSLKKAEVVFEVLHASDLYIDEDLNTSRFMALGDLIEYLEAGPSPETGKMKTEKILAPFLRYKPDWVPQTQNIRLGPHPEVFRVLQVSLADITDENSAVRARIIEGVNSTEPDPLMIRIELPKTDRGMKPRQWEQVVKYWRDLLPDMTPANKIFLALVGPHAGQTYAGLRAFFQSFSKENREWIFMPVGCLKGRPDDQWLWEQINRPRNVERKFSDGKVWERTWNLVKGHEKATGTFGGQPDVAAINEGDSTPEKSSVANAQVYKPKKMVWLGGTGGVAAELLMSCPFRSEVDLHVLGRRSIEEMSVMDRVGLFEVEYANVEYHQVDASHERSLHEVLDHIASSGEIDMIVNAAGVDRSSQLKTKTNSEIKEELYSKLGPGVCLNSWLAKHPNVYGVQFSSIAGIFGNGGQSVYALGNSAISADTLKSKKSKNLVIHWPAWENIGMTARPAIRVSLIENGIPTLKSEEASMFFWDEISRKPTGEVTYLTEPYIFDEIVRALRFDKIHEFMGIIPNHRRRMPEKFFRLSHDYYLLDHRLEQMAVVPAATQMVMFQQMAFLMYGEYRQVRDFSVVNMIPVDQTGIPLNLSVRPSGDKLRFYLRSLAPHARAEMGKRETKTKKMRKPWEAKADGAELDIRGYYESGKLFHGPRMQMLHEAWRIDGECIRGRVDLTKLTPIYSIDYFDTLMLMLDGVFQLMITNNSLQRNFVGLPSSVKKFQYNADVEWGGELWIQVDTTGSSFENGSIGRGVIYNSKNEVVADLEGIKAVSYESIYKMARELNEV